jgi:integrase/recombinase XerD
VTAPTGTAPAPAAAATGGAPAAPEPSQALLRAVRAYLDHLAVERGLAANSLSAYRRDLRRYLEFLARHGIDDLDAVGPLLVEDFLHALRSGDAGGQALALSSAARAVVAVRGLHRFAAREGLTTSDAASEVRPPAPDRRLPKAIALDQVEALLEAAGRAGTATALRDRALLELLYATGARIGEAVALDVGDLLPPEPGGVGEVRLHGKGGRDRDVPVGHFAQAAVEAYLVRGRPTLVTPRTGRALFLNARGGRLSRQSAWAVLQRAARDANLDIEVSPHTLRHTCATHLLDGGADVRVVQDLLGHASVTTTQLYTLVTADRLREVYAAYHPRAR